LGTRRIITYQKEGSAAKPPNLLRILFGTLFN
jgi:hypothetical protein